MHLCAEFHDLFLLSRAPVVKSGKDGVELENDGCGHLAAPKVCGRLLCIFFWTV